MEDLRTVLQRNGFAFKKQFGQNFISDTNLLRSIVQAAGINKESRVLEIGCGAGTLTRELAACIDRINVSLNEATAEDYVKLCRPAFGEAAFAGLQDFAKKCAQRGIDTWFSVVDVIGEEKIGQCRRIARECGVALRVRAYIG